jgi:hypothetical protein
MTGNYNETLKFAGHCYEALAAGHSQSRGIPRLSPPARVKLCATIARPAPAHR